MYATIMLEFTQIIVNEDVDCTDLYYSSVSLISIISGICVFFCDDLRELHTMKNGDDKSYFLKNNKFTFVFH